MKVINKSVTRIGIVGTGYVGRGIAMLANRMPDLTVSRILTRRDIGSCGDAPLPELLTT